MCDGVTEAVDVVPDGSVLLIARIERPPAGPLLAGQADETGYQVLVEALVQFAGPNPPGLTMVTG